MSGQRFCGAWRGNALIMQTNGGTPPKALVLAAAPDALGVFLSRLDNWSQGRPLQNVAHRPSGEK